MILTYATLFVITLHGIRFQRFDREYSSKEVTTAVKGLFVPMVFFSHFKGYITFNGGRADWLFGFVNTQIGQLMVVMFLFYSGYGIMVQIMQRKDEYVNSFLRKRMFPTWLQFALCLTLYVIQHCVRGTIGSLKLSTILYSYIGWKSIGNSNWFMFDIFVLYLIVFAAFRLPLKDYRVRLIVFTLCSAFFTAWLYFKKASWWWNTIMLFPLGMWYAWFKSDIDHCLEKPGMYWLAAIPAWAAFIALWYLQRRIGLKTAVFIPYAMIFALLTVLTTMKVRVGNGVLHFFGRHVFSIYILQRLPMRALQGVITNRFLYFSVCLVITLAASSAFDNLFRKYYSFFGGGIRS